MNPTMGSWDFEGLDDSTSTDPDTGDALACSPNCIQHTGFGTHILADVIIHALIILIIISSFYFLFVAQLSKNVYRKELTHAVETAAGSMVRQLPSTALQGLHLHKLKEHLAVTPTQAHEIQNKWLLNVTVMMVLFFVIILMLMIAILKYSCSASIGPLFKTILAQNAAVFLFVGVIEIGFFLQIARYYIPVKPSLLAQVTIQYAKDVLAGRKIDTKFRLKNVLKR